MSELKLAKRAFRQKIGALLQSVAASDIESQTAVVEQRVLEADWFKKADRISVYVSTQGEIVTDGIVKKALELGKQVFIPRFIKGCPDMEMLRLPSMAEFETLDSSLWGIRQYAQDFKGESYVETGPLDLVLMPAVAFTKEGKRLGHGKGFYDRFMSAHRAHFDLYPRMVGLGLKQQIVDSLPQDDTDVVVDLVLTA